MPDYKKRSDVPEQYRWKLEDIYPSKEAWQEDSQKLELLLAQAEQYQGHTAGSAAELLETLQWQDQINLLVDRLTAYALMKKDEDNTDPQSQVLAGQAISLAVNADSDTAFVVPEILQLSSDQLEQFLSENQELELYRHYLEDIFRQRQHYRSPAEEKLISRTGEMSMGPRNIYAMLHDADLSFPEVEIENKQVRITNGNFTDLMQSPSRETRQKVYDTFYDAYKENLHTWSAILSSSVTKDLFYTKVRNYDSTLDAALDSDNVPMTVYDNLIAAVHQNLNSMYRYMALRKRLLGVDKLEMYDVYVPLVKETSFRFDYNTAQELVLDALQPLGPEYRELLKTAFNSRWLDVYETKGKTSGAYSNSTYGVHPFVLLNFTGNLDSVSTIAHELGHAMHSYYTNKNQPFLYSHYSIFVAEVASTFNEALLLDHLLKVTKNQTKRLYLLQDFLEQVRATVYRQTMFAEFEKMIHSEVAASGSLTSDFLCKTYLQLNQTYYGPEMHSGERISWEWARIPHFYNAFYVYKYATGFAAAQALSQQVLGGGEKERERYLGFLKAGNSDYPLNLLKNAGVNLLTPAPVQAALDLFPQRLEEFEDLIASHSVAQKAPSV